MGEMFLNLSDEKVSKVSLMSHMARSITTIAAAASAKTFFALLPLFFVVRTFARPGVLANKRVFWPKWPNVT